MNYLTETINEGNLALIFCIDIEKCFDSLNYDILYTKLENCGIRGICLNLFKDFLTNRTQRVKIGSTLSENCCNIDIGVLQGSLIGVILFMIFIIRPHRCLVRCTAVHWPSLFGCSQMDR